MLYFAEGSPTGIIDDAHARRLVESMLVRLGTMSRVLLLPPDHTRFHSGAGALTVLLYQRLHERTQVEVMPTLGTHTAMSEAERRAMFPGIPAQAFRDHNWREDLVRLGEVPAAFIREVSNGRVEFPVYCEVNRVLVEGGWDRIISIGQLVPHEVAGIANHAQNVLVGAGGQDTINKTHYLGAVCGMEDAMGRARTPVRQVLDYMSEHFASELPLSYVLTVRDKDAQGGVVTRGLFAGDDVECFVRGADLCQRVNINLLDEPIRKGVVYLDPREYRSTWLGNKAIYRLRMALATGGELLVLAPGVRTFGEDAEIDRLIRRFGYRGTPSILEAVAAHADLAANLAAAAHLIHGSSEGRFTITYGAGGLSRREVEDVGYDYADVMEVMARYAPETLRDGWNDVAGERIYFVSNPGLGLWSSRARFECEMQDEGRAWC